MLKHLWRSLAGLFVLACASNAEAVTHSEAACNTNPDYVFCFDADTWTANCTLGSETACWTDNGTGETVFRYDDWRQWRINNKCQAAVGSGCYEAVPRPGSTGPGYSLDQWSTVAPHSAQVTLRYYHRRSEGYPGLSSHGPALQSLTGAATSCSTMAIQPAAFTFNLLYTSPGGSTCSNSLDASARTTRIYMNLPAATTSGLCYNERWCRVELFLQKETSVTDADADNLEDQGECNGIVRMWIDDTLVLENTDFCFGMMSYSGGAWSSNNSGFSHLWNIREYIHRAAPWPGKIAIDNMVVDVGAHSGTGPYIGAAPNENYLGVADTNSPYYILNGVPNFYACLNTAGGGCGNAEAAQVNGTWGGRKTSSDCSSGNQYFGSEVGSGGQWPAGTGTAGEYNFDTYVLSLEEKIQTENTDSTCSVAVTHPVKEASVTFTVLASACVSNVTCGQGFFLDHTIGALQLITQNGPSSYVTGTCSYLLNRACGPSFMPKVRVVSGWIYIPSAYASAFTNCETGTLIAGSAFPTAQPCPALAGFATDASGNGGTYLAVTRTAAGNFAVVQRYNNNYLKRALYDSGTPISLDTWHKFEIIAWVDRDVAADRDKVSLMLDGATVITKQALTYTIASDDGAGLTNGEDWMACRRDETASGAPSSACGHYGKWVLGIISNQTGYDLKIHIDSYFFSTMSMQSCAGWGTWCPFETHKIGNLGGGF